MGTQSSAVSRVDLRPTFLLKCVLKSQKEKSEDDPSKIRTHELKSEEGT